VIEIVGAWLSTLTVRVPEADELPATSAVTT